MESAQKTWELENAVKLVDPHRDALYTYDKASIDRQAAAKPWRTDPHHFKHVRISAVALIKMVMHARSGGSLEIMGLMQGSYQGDTLIVTDAFRLPVEGTETRVNAQDEANEYMVQFLQLARESGQMENAVGWYHSHPGYGCWLSGIDVDTQHAQQSFLDPFCAVVIDPDRTISAGKVEIGAFRTYPEDYKPAGGASGDGFETIPLAKVEDFGAHSHRYYSLEVSHFKSTLDSKLLEVLWNKYWVGTLSSSPLIANRDYGTKQIYDLAQKIRQADKALGDSTKRNQGGQGFTMRQNAKADRKVKEEQMDKIVRAGAKISSEEQVGLMAGTIKDKLFTGLAESDPTS